MSPIVRSLDVGFGTTKFVVGASGQNFQCQMFPSVALPASTMELSTGLLSQAKTIVVEVDGRRYEVGPQIEYKSRTSRVLHDDYIRTPEYMALTRGAFHYMDVPHIDTLVVGLPVSHITSHREELEERMGGLHRLPNGRLLPVRHVIGLAQPIGGFIAYAKQTGGFDKMCEEVNLIIDPGFFTFDWVVAKGLLLDPERSGSHNGGISAVLRKIGETIGHAHHGKPYDDLGAIDAGLRTGNFKLCGREEPLARYLTSATPITEQSVNAMCNSVGDGRNIDNITIVGGGASLFSKAIAKRFPDHQVQVVDDAIFANVRGFQYVGEEIRRSMGWAA